MLLSFLYFSLLFHYAVNVFEREVYVHLFFGSMEQIDPSLLEHSVLILSLGLMKVFGDKAFEKSGKGFISMHFSDQHPGLNKKMLVFKFALPDENQMADMTRLVALVPYYIDLIGRYKLSSHVSITQF